MKFEDIEEIEIENYYASRILRSGNPDDSENFRRGRAPKGWYRQPESRSNWEKARTRQKRQRICRP
jgi:hypothetical protein